MQLKGKQIEIHTDFEIIRYNLLLVVLFKKLSSCFCQELNSSIRSANKSNDCQLLINNLLIVFKVSAGTTEHILTSHTAINHIFASF